MRPLAELQDLFSKELDSRRFGEQPENLYEPYHYILSLGGKRLRPVLTLLACESFGKPAEMAMDAAMSIELLHNFSLIHDDIMDEAPLRRGRETVHERWGINVGILSGDVMLVDAFRQLLSLESGVLKPCLETYSKAAKDICEGQQWDVDFETRMDVTEEEYIKMIQYKTSVLLGAALEMGARIAGADEAGAQHCYRFGLNFGTAFQIKDDLLDAFGDPELFGKQVGGDILTNKKTILLIHALAHAEGVDKEELLGWLKEDNTPKEKVAAVKAIYQRVGSVRYAEQRMEAFYRMALSSLDECGVHGADTREMRNFVDYLYHRDH